MRVACHFDHDNRRSTHIARCMAAGIQACGDDALLIGGWEVTTCDVAVAYGWGHPDMFEAYRARGGAFVYVDLGWWERKPDGRVLDGYHKVCVNGREPGARLERPWPDDRFATFGIEIEPWRTTGHHIVLTGMSEKSAGTRGYQPYEWEKNALAEIRRFTDRPVIYRPKPSWLAARPIEGAGWSPPTESIQRALKHAWALVTLHSNTAVDALLAGVPVHAAEGVAASFSTPLAEIEATRLPYGREQLMAAIAYQQWSTGEMASGACWRHLVETGAL